MKDLVNLDRLKIVSLSVSNRKNYKVSIKEILFNPDKKNGIRCNLSIFIDEVKILCDLYFTYKGISDKSYSYLFSLKEFVEKVLNEDDRLQEISRKISYGFNSRLDFYFEEYFEKWFLTRQNFYVRI